MPFEVILKLYELEPLLHRLTSGRFLFLYLVCRCSWLIQAPVPMAHFLIVAFAVSDYTVFDTHLICGWENRRSCNRSYFCRAVQEELTDLTLRGTLNLHRKGRADRTSAPGGLTLRACNQHFINSSPFRTQEFTAWA